MQSGKVSESKIQKLPLPEKQDFNYNYKTKGLLLSNTLACRLIVFLDPRKVDLSHLVD